MAPSEDPLLKEQVALVIINKMMIAKHIDICLIRDTATMLSIESTSLRERQAYKMLAPLHCVSFSELPTELKRAIPSLIIECLDLNVSIQNQLSMMMKAA